MGHTNLRTAKVCYLDAERDELLQSLYQTIYLQKSSLAKKRPLRFKNLEPMTRFELANRCLQNTVQLLHSAGLTGKSSSIRYVIAAISTLCNRAWHKGCRQYGFDLRSRVLIGTHRKR